MRGVGELITRDDHVALQEHRLVFARLVELGAERGAPRAAPPVYPGTRSVLGTGVA
ncbi:MAG: hypothetical protein HC850_09540 [Rhodomicrobium sp.]|nr:hypothetical protein [Rhodomicrobium sp.]